ncbi:MAG: helix-turn-helix domain-containing protein [Actinomycetota bacterium]|nr:helix-turn-helix domain-containing protein [Actinomycetota bacterium]
MARRMVAVTRASEDALGVLANQIKAARAARGWTQVDLAARVGITQKTMYAIESGSPSVSIGSVFNAAFTVGVNLFGLEGADLARARRQGEDTLALLPERVRRPIVKENADDSAF